MISEEEKWIFIRELRRLIDDYQKCPDTEFREQIHEEIMQLISVID
ncbi:hypothetical protein [Bacillus sp. REN3]|nr:hypothetical protein [Bacillus sp. REN3]